MRRRVILGVACAALVALTGVGTAAGPRPRFGAPVRLTPDLTGGFEPGVVVDRFGNVFATAHKDTAEVVVSPDPGSADGARTTSWVWASYDGGTTWADLPMGPASAYDDAWGIEGALALDDAGHLYFTDTYAADVTFTRWSVTGRGRVAHDLSTVLTGTAQAFDDRPWLTAHGDGTVFFLVNKGDQVYATPGGDGDGTGPGRAVVNVSRDRGATFDRTGVTLADSGWCHPAADHASGSHFVYVLCTDDGNVDGTGHLWAYVSPDDGRTFHRYPVGTYNVYDAWWDWPTVQVARDGTVWALYVDGQTPSCPPGSDVGACVPESGELRLYRSADQGRSWRSWTVTPRPGQYRYAWLSVAPDGRHLGFAVYHRPTANDPWQVYAAEFSAGQRPVLVPLDPAHPVAPASAYTPPGDYLGSAYGPDARLHVIWTRMVDVPPGAPQAAVLHTEIWYARAR